MTGGCGEAGLGPPSGAVDTTVETSNSMPGTEGGRVDGGEARKRTPATTSLNHPLLPGSERLRCATSSVQRVSVPGRSAVAGGWGLGRVAAARMTAEGRAWLGANALMSALPFVCLGSSLADPWAFRGDEPPQVQLPAKWRDRPRT